MAVSDSPSPPARGFFWAAMQLLLFVAFATVFYRIFPQFLIQNHDAQNVYFTITKGLEWRASIFEIYAYSPLAALGTTFWPFFFPAIPYLAVFGLTEDPTLRIYLLQIAAASTLFAGSLFFFSAIGIERRIASAASWMTFVVIMLYGLAHVSAPENLMVTVWLFVALGALAKTGRGPLVGDLAWAALFQVSVIGFVLAVPAWHIIALPVFATSVLMLFWRADTGRQRIWRIGCALLAAIIQLAAGTYDALRYTLTDTARVTLREMFADHPHYRTIGGHLLNNTPIDVLVGTLFIIGIGWIRERDMPSSDTRAMHAATVLVYLALTATGLVFYYTSGPWPFPLPKYLLMFAYPLTALFAVHGMKALFERRMEQNRIWSVAVLLAIYFGWHVLDSSGGALRSIAFAVGICFIAALVSRFTIRPLGVAVIALGLTFGCLRFVAHAFGSGADERFDGTLRAGIARTPVIDYLAERVSLAPGTTFRGVVEDIYSRPPGSKELIDGIISRWAGNWMKYGNRHKLFAWNVMGIPTSAEYSQYTKPPYFLLYTRFLNEPDDRQVLNYLSATRPDTRVLQMLGVRYVVTDLRELELKGGREVFSWDKFRVLELAEPNLANYSPVRASYARTAEQALRRIGGTDFDPREDVVTHDPGELSDLVRARDATLFVERGGFRVEANSAGRSLLLLPVQFSHCFAIDGQDKAKLLRANLALTGVLFSGRLDVVVRYHRWPSSPTDCQARDLQDTRRLLATVAN